jgi:prepilin-type N-terminal cleavage/methylation domain-containing protein
MGVSEAVAGDMRRDQGMTLIEILTTIAISAILMTLGASALRSYWFNRALHDGAEQVVSELRNAHDRSVSESHPLVYGGWFDQDSAEWGVVRFDPKDVSVPGDDECVVVSGPNEFSAGVVVQDVTFEDVSPQTTVCAAAVPPGAEIAFFFARGTASPGDVTLVQPKDGDTETITVTGLTGRVDRQ